jgi:hypothetical protein
MTYIGPEPLEPRFVSLAFALVTCSCGERAFVVIGTLADGTTEWNKTKCKCGRPFTAPRSSSWTPPGRKVSTVLHAASAARGEDHEAVSGLARPPAHGPDHKRP